MHKIPWKVCKIIVPKFHQRRKIKFLHMPVELLFRLYYHLANTVTYVTWICLSILYLADKNNYNNGNQRLLYIYLIFIEWHCSAFIWYTQLSKSCIFVLFYSTMLNSKRRNFIQLWDTIYKIKNYKTNLFSLSAYHNTLLIKVFFLLSIFQLLWCNPLS